MVEDSEIVREFKRFGREFLLSRLSEAEVGYVDRQKSYDDIVAAYKSDHGWPEDLSRLEPGPFGKMRPVYINRLHWIAADLAGEGS